MIHAPLAVSQTISLAGSALPGAPRSAAASPDGRRGRTRRVTATALHRFAHRLAGEGQVAAAR